MGGGSEGYLNEGHCGLGLDCKLYKCKLRCPGKMKKRMMFRHRKVKNNRRKCRNIPLLRGSNSKCSRLGCRFLLSPKRRSYSSSWLLSFSELVFRCLSWPTTSSNIRLTMIRLVGWVLQTATLHFKSPKQCILPYLFTMSWSISTRIIDCTRIR